MRCRTRRGVCGIKGKTMKILAIHQPDFLPYSGFFYKLDKCDKFLIGDYYNYSNNGYIQRVKLGGEWLTEFVVRKHDITLDTTICNICIDAQITYDRILSAMDKHLKNAPYYKEVRHMIKAWWEGEGSYLRDDFPFGVPLSLFNTRLIICIAKHLGIEGVSDKICYLKGDKPDKAKGECIVEIMKRQFPDYSYLSGSGGKSYIGSEFSDAGIELMFSEHKAKYSDSILTVLAYEDDPLSIVRNEI